VRSELRNRRTNGKERRRRSSKRVCHPRGKGSRPYTVPATTRNGPKRRPPKATPKITPKAKN
jgi:hypothetical protein